MDIKAKIEELVEKIKKNPALLKRFNAEPVKVVEELVGIDLPDELIEKVVDGVKAKITVDKVGDALGALGGLFRKKYSIHRPGRKTGSVCAFAQTLCGIEQCTAGMPGAASPTRCTVVIVGAVALDGPQSTPENK